MEQTPAPAAGGDRGRLLWCVRSLLPPRPHPRRRDARLPFKQPTGDEGSARSVRRGRIAADRGAAASATVGCSNGDRRGRRRRGVVRTDTTDVERRPRVGGCQPSRCDRRTPCCCRMRGTCRRWHRLGSATAAPARPSDPSCRSARVGADASLTAGSGTRRHRLRCWTCQLRPRVVRVSMASQRVGQSGSGRS
jgi:hypothetical protein